jgi:aspartate beta-hydroxylase
MEKDPSSFKTEDFSETSDVEDFKKTILYKKLNELFKEYLLSEVQSLAAFKFIKDKFSNPDLKNGEAVKKWVLMKVNNKKLPENYHKMQLGCPDLVPNLKIQNFWDPSQFTWVDELISNFNIIKEELITLREGKGFQPYKSPSFASDLKSSDNMGSYAHDKGEWNVFYLFLHDLKFEENCGKAPKTAEIIQRIVPRQY